MWENKNKGRERKIQRVQEGQSKGPKDDLEERRLAQLYFLILPDLFEKTLHQVILK